MTEPPRAPVPDGRTAAWVVTAVWAAGGVLLAAVLFAPVLQGGFCADSSDPALSYCEAWQRSVAGVDTNVWLWAGATIALGALGWLVARTRRLRRG